MLLLSLYMEVPMEANFLTENKVITSMEEKKDAKNVSNKKPPKKAQNNSKTDMYKEKKCNVLLYNKKSNVLDVNFDGYGIRIFNVKNFNGKSINVKFKGVIGNPDFQYKV